jgi:hypothetical protein
MKTYAEEVVLEHINLCNKLLCNGHRTEKEFLFVYKIGELVATKQAYPRNIIGTIHGYIYSPFSNSYRAVLGVDCDIEVDNIRIAEEKESLAFNLFTKEFNPVESRMTCLI